MNNLIVPGECQIWPFFRTEKACCGLNRFGARWLDWEWRSVAQNLAAQLNGAMRCYDRLAAAQ